MYHARPVAKLLRPKLPFGVTSFTRSFSSKPESGPRAPDSEHQTVKRRPPPPNTPPPFHLSKVEASKLPHPYYKVKPGFQPPVGERGLNRPAFGLQASSREDNARPNWVDRPVFAARSQARYDSREGGNSNQRYNSREGGNSNQRYNSPGRGNSYQRNGSDQVPHFRRKFERPLDQKLNADFVIPRWDLDASSKIQKVIRETGLGGEMENINREFGRARKEARYGPREPREERGFRRVSSEKNPRRREGEPSDGAESSMFTIDTSRMGRAEVEKAGVEKERTMADFGIKPQDENAATFLDYQDRLRRIKTDMIEKGADTEESHRAKEWVMKWKPKTADEKRNMTLLAREKVKIEEKLEVEAGTEDPRVDRLLQVWLEKRVTMAASRAERNNSFKAKKLAGQQARDRKYLRAANQARGKWE